MILSCPSISSSWISLGRTLHPLERRRRRKGIQSDISKNTWVALELYIRLHVPAPCEKMGKSGAARNAASDEHTHTCFQCMEVFQSLKHGHRSHPFRTLSGSGLSYVSMDKRELWEYTYLHAYWKKLFMCEKSRKDTEHDAALSSDILSLTRITKTEEIIVAKQIEMVTFAFWFTLILSRGIPRLYQPFTYVRTWLAQEEKRNIRNLSPSPISSFLCVHI